MGEARSDPSSRLRRVAFAEGRLRGQKRSVESSTWVLHPSATAGRGRRSRPRRRSGRRSPPPRPSPPERGRRRRSDERGEEDPKEIRPVSRAQWPPVAIMPAGHDGGPPPHGTSQPHQKLRGQQLTAQPTPSCRPANLSFSLCLVRACVCVEGVSRRAHGGGVCGGDPPTERAEEKGWPHLCGGESLLVGRARRGRPGLDQLLPLDPHLRAPPPHRHHRTAPPARPAQHERLLQNLSTGRPWRQGAMP